MADAALQRRNMVESQVRPSDVTDRRITAAMQALEREPFVPEALRPLAYSDEAVAVSSERAMLAPRTLARLVQLAAIDSTDRVLDIGCLTGYSAALLSHLCKEVVALECDNAFAAEARETLAALGLSNVEVVAGKLTAGYLARAPFDVIVVEGAVGDVPETLIAQVTEGGRLVAIEQGKAGLGHAVVITKTASGFGKRTAFEASAPMLPGFAKPQGFVF